MNRQSGWVLLLLAGAFASAGATDGGPDGEATTSAGAPTSGERRALVLCVTKWNGGCEADNRTWWDNMVSGWYDDFTDDRSTPSGHSSEAWIEDGFYKNGDIIDNLFTDDDIVSWGEDDWNDNVDDDDAVMIALHGSHNGSTGSWLGSVRVDASGDPNCWAWQGHMELGDHDLEFLHLSSCHSMCSPYENTASWASSFKGVHQIDGFYGLMWISAFYQDNYKDFSDDAFCVSIADAWIDELYINNASGSYDQCPVAESAGADVDDASNRLSSEEYDYVFDDPSVPSTIVYLRLAGCDPSGHNP
jgi:hypothetical protein